MQKIDLQRILGHPVRLENLRLQPWTSVDTILTASMRFIKDCPTADTLGRVIPWYLASARLRQDGTIFTLQNNQGSNLFYAMETFRRYYAYTGDIGALKPVKDLAENIALYLTPDDFAWPGVPRTQDDTPGDGVYDDEKGEPDKACMVASAFVDYSRFTGDRKWLELAEGIARTILAHVTEGTEDESPLPFRVNLRTGDLIYTEGIPENYTADMITAVKMIDDLLAAGTSLDHKYLKDRRQTLLDWIFAHPMRNNRWCCYFEDVKEVSRHDNVNQIIPLETARYLLKHPECDPQYEQHVRQLIYFVKYRFGFTRRYGATSVGEQDACIGEMGSHTARYASVVGKWFAQTGDPLAREEARASLSLSTYSAYNEHSRNGRAVNYTGIGFLNPWFSDSYFDYLTHILEGMEEIPELVPSGTSHLFYTSSMIKEITYGEQGITYTALDADGQERLRLDFAPVVYADGKLLPEGEWSFGVWRGVDNILTINRKGVSRIEIKKR